MEKEGTLFEGELVDTRGGYTFRDVNYVINENGEVTFYEYFYGVRGEDFNGGICDTEYGNIVEEDFEIEDFKRILSNVKE